MLRYTEYGLGIAPSQRLVCDKSNASTDFSAQRAPRQDKLESGAKSSSHVGPSVLGVQQ